MLTTTPEYKQSLKDGNRNFTARLDIVLTDGSVIQVPESRIMQGGLKIEDATSGSSSFDVGSVIINKLTVGLLNNDEMIDTGLDWRDFDFVNAMVVPWIGLRIDQRVEWLRKGVFTVDRPTHTDSIMTLSCLDNMERFDRPFEAVNDDLVYPTTLAVILNAICEATGVELVHVLLNGLDYVVEREPEQVHTLTMREVLSNICQIIGAYARFNIDGHLELKWYDTSYDFTEGNIEIDNSMAHITLIASESYAVSDVEFTGVLVGVGDHDWYSAGEEGYRIRITRNRLIQGKQVTEPETPENQYNRAEAISNGQIVADMVADRIVGMRFRPLEVKALADPSIEAGDIAVITDRRGRNYFTYITRLSYRLGGFTTYSCRAETPSMNQSTRFSLENQIVLDPNEANRIVSMQDQFYLSTSNSQQIGGSWEFTLPQWIDGRFYWRRMFITYADGSTVTTLPRLDMSLAPRTIGARNYLLQSGRRLETEDNPIAEYDLSARIGSAQRMFLQVACILGEGAEGIRVYNSDTDHLLTVLNAQDRSIDGVYRKDFVWSRGTSSNDKLILIAEPSMTTNTVITWSQLEIGNSPTDWRPAPEDTLFRDDTFEVSIPELDIDGNQVLDENGFPVFITVPRTIEEFITNVNLDLFGINVEVGRVRIEVRDGIQMVVEDIRTLAQQTADDINFAIFDLLNNAESQLVIDLQGIRTSISDNAGNIFSMRQDIDGMEVRVTDAEGSIATNIVSIEQIRNELAGLDFSGGSVLDENGWKWWFARIGAYDGDDLSDFSQRSTVMTINENGIEIRNQDGANIVRINSAEFVGYLRRQGLPDLRVFEVSGDRVYTERLYVRNGANFRTGTILPITYGTREALVVVKGGGSS